MAINKVVYGGTTIIDITDATATADKILQGYTAYGADGSKLIGTASGGGNSPVWQGSDDYVYLSDTVEAPVAIYTDNGYIVLDLQPAVINLQTKTRTYTPSENQQTEVITADNDYDGLSEVGITVNAIPSDYIGSDILNGDQIGYGLTDGTLPLVGVAKAGYAEI